MYRDILEKFGYDLQKREIESEKGVAYSTKDGKYIVIVGLEIDNETIFTIFDGEELNIVDKNCNIPQDKELLELVSNRKEELLEECLILKSRDFLNQIRKMI